MENATYRGFFSELDDLVRKHEHEPLGNQIKQKMGEFQLKLQRFELFELADPTRSATDTVLRTQVAAFVTDLQRLFMTQGFTLADV